MRLHVMKGKARRARGAAPSRAFQVFGSLLNRGAVPYVVSVGLLVLATVLVYLGPRSITAFLLFIGAAVLTYFLDMNKAVKLVMAVVVAVVIVPVLGARNISYLEIIFQISVFSALALGLNIVVGFSGLLNFGYMAFYAVGAYLWGFFGSQQPFLLHAIPGTVPPAHRSSSRRTGSTSSCSWASSSRQSWVSSWASRSSASAAITWP